MDFTTILLIIVFFIGLIAALWVGIRIGEFKKHREWEKQIPGLRQEAVEKSRQVLSGNFSEQLAPYLPDFKYNPSDCRFIGKPIDMIVFNGLSDGSLKDVIFLEIKSGDSKLNSNQKELKRVVDSGKVKFEEYRIPKDLTEKK